MPPRRGRSRRTAEESRAPVSSESIQQTETADVTRLIGELESVLSKFRPTTGRTFQSMRDASQSFHSPQRSQQANRRKFRPRGKQFKKGSNTSSSGSLSSSGSSFGGGVTCEQCGGRHMTSRCRGVRGSCHRCGQSGHFARVCPLLRGSVVEKKPVATIQQQRNFSSWRLATQTSSSPRKFGFSRCEARLFVQETPPVEIRKDCSCVQGRFHAVTVELREEMAPSVPSTRAAAALRMKQIALDNQDRTIRRLRAQLATERRGLAATKKELEETQVALEASHKVITGLTEIGLSMSKKIERMKVKKQKVRENHVECHQKFQARIHEAEDSMQAQHLLIEALVDEKDSLLKPSTVSKKLTMPCSIRW
ncbi:hypothetical protein F511_23659 [Dorcoceras hygrometricum]|uniref:CCHC-type domain-containing protein n=1 Tax=Dorcoceras hygrometricum TaxID=472368 RepID=A0A2Z7CFB0_9LAMI|nr:hypothetical protein F511_23659 [Dorcoceras hygrometricum]